MYEITCDWLVYNARRCTRFSCSDRPVFMLITRIPDHDSFARTWTGTTKAHTYLTKSHLSTHKWFFVFKHSNTYVLNSKQWNSLTLVNAKFIIMFPEQYPWHWSSWRSLEMNWEEIINFTSKNLDFTSMWMQKLFRCWTVNIMCEDVEDRVVCLRVMYCVKQDVVNKWSVDRYVLYASELTKENLYIEFNQ